MKSSPPPCKHPLIESKSCMDPFQTFPVIGQTNQIFTNLAQIRVEISFFTNFSLIDDSLSILFCLQVRPSSSSLSAKVSRCWSAGPRFLPNLGYLSLHLHLHLQSYRWFDLENDSRSSIGIHKDFHGKIWRNSGHNLTRYAEL